jgi:hypothetical protein
VEPGLYSLGNPAPESPVFVTANYTMSFDALRSNLKGVDGYILVLDTKGINVWCAAGKGTFGTEELMDRIKVTGLENVVSHRKVILPQLGAAGVSAFSLKEWCGWNVEYGPVRAEDLPEYLKTHRAAPEMRKVRFGLWAHTRGAGQRLPCNGGGLDRTLLCHGAGGSPGSVGLHSGGRRAVPLVITVHTGEGL